MENRTYVRQYLDLDLPDSLRPLNLRLLEFKGNSLLEVSAKVDGEEISLKRQDSDGLVSISATLPKGNSTPKLELQYTLATATAEHYIPFFFTELAASDSDNDFYALQLRLPEKQEYTLHFTNVPVKELFADGTKEVRFQVPALISVLRMELHPEARPQWSFAQLMDGMVVLIFLIMGVVIWLNRKRLAYG